MRTEITVFLLTLVLLLLVISCVLFMLGILREDKMKIPPPLKRVMTAFWWATAVGVTFLVLLTGNWYGILLGPLLATLGLVPGLYSTISGYVQLSYTQTEKGKDADKEPKQA